MTDLFHRVDFHKEVKIMCQLRDPNIVQVLGVCNREDFLCVVVEYMKYGDLYQYLQKHTLEGVANIDNLPTLRFVSFFSGFFWCFSFITV